MFSLMSMMSMVHGMMGMDVDKMGMMDDKMGMEMMAGCHTGFAAGRQPCDQRSLS